MKCTVNKPVMIYSPDKIRQFNVTDLTLLDKPLEDDRIDPGIVTPKDMTFYTLNHDRQVYHETCD